MEETKRKVVLAIGKDVVGVEIVHLKELAKEQNVDLEIIEDDGEGIRRLNVPEPPVLPFINSHKELFDDLASQVKYAFPEMTHKQWSQVAVPVRTEPKIHRNSHCPCGSGKKIKKCCIK